jgi:Phospholipase_D-nuclease N-terminal
MGNREEEQTMTQRSWSDLSPNQQTAVLVLASIEMALTATAAVDLYRRPSHQVRGPKPLWWLGIFVQPIGPMAYLGWGRRTRVG